MAQVAMTSWSGQCSPMAPSPAQARRKPRRAKAQAEQLIEAHLKDPNFLLALLRHSPTADFLAETLKRRASQDEVFADLVVQCCMPRTPKMTKTPSTPCKRSASTMKSRVKSESTAIWQSVAPRSLLAAFEESPECPAKAARLLDVEASVLDPLPSVLVAQVSSYLKLREKVQLLGSNRQARSLRQMQCTWQPLVLEAEDCAYILRRIRKCDPQGHLEPKFYPGPACPAWTEVTDVRVELMEPDRHDANGEPLTSFRKASSMAKYILDPIHEFARRLSAGWFAGAQHLRLSNIEANCMDSGFLDFRLTAFRDYSQLKLEQDGLDPTKYCLYASQAISRPPSISDGLAMVQQRFPQSAGINLLLNSPEEITESEALFLQEHTLMVKTGHTFRSVERLWHVIAESEVRELYDSLHAQLMHGLQMPCSVMV